MSRHPCTLHSRDGNDGSCFDERRLGLVGDQLAQKRNQHDEHDTDREAAEAKLREQRRVPAVGRDRRGAGRLGDHPREVAGKERREAGHQHPAAHHHDGLRSVAIAVSWRRCPSRNRVKRFAHAVVRA
jgi:hypothetical protein